MEFYYIEKKLKEKEKKKMIQEPVILDIIDYNGKIIKF